MKKYLILWIFILINSTVWADEYVDEENFDRPTIFEIQANEKKEKLDALAEEAREYSTISNKWYENDKIRIYNNTLYELDAENFKAGGMSEPTAIKDFKFSIGYGMEYKIDSERKIGYEYVSNFPYDRGQMLRFFWSKSF
ncbi:hypothetical protein B9T31_03375 [Acinetobacter sp. ANC 4558]|uniref:hypothetical protein n=1 Tax=Acinetobacter sp. ANC 4558 TaxID=1977876 RepID=UPI000A3534E2|nr:hypothetical protein [Acinetobacter sp. ANC 4558]OTG87555.1 hypothetical protein B9T31_03375 [Acinetobacter sp. ANC 4558]